MCYFSLIPLSNICCIPLRYWARYRANSDESILYTALALIDNTNLCVKVDIKQINIKLYTIIYAMKEQDAIRERNPNLEEGWVWKTVL